MNDLSVADEHEDDDPSIDDEDGRAALVETILKLAAKVRNGHGVRLFLGDGAEPLDHAASLRGHPLWLLAEFLCILIVPGAPVERTCSSAHSFCAQHAATLPLDPTLHARSPERFPLAA